MAKEMLINVSEGEECRIALLEDGRLEELYMERTSATSHVGNIYKGRVTNVEPSIQAAFIDFGLGRNGFLHISDLMPTYFGKRGDFVETVGRKLSRRDRPPIQRCLRRGDDIVVQIIKEGIGTKGPTLSTYLSIPGRILVMMPGMANKGVSKKIEDEQERRRLRQILDGLEPPDDCGFIIRTAGVGKTKLEIERDLKYLARLWETLKKKRDAGPGPTELYTEGDLVTRTVRDVFTSDIERIVIDSKEVAKRVKEVIKITAPRTRNKVDVYEDLVPLFHTAGIEREIEMIYSRHVPLPSGGSLVIDTTEAVVAIDVNSGKSREHADAETTAFNTDMEAADEIPRQLKLRDLGGVIICDFIDLRYERHRRELEQRLHDNFKNDRAKTKVLRMSQFGIIELTRQRMRPSLKRSIYFDCPHCRGAGLVKTPESMSLDVMRRLAIAANDQAVVRVELAVCPDVAFYLLNRKRTALADLEHHARKSIVVRQDATLALDEMKLNLFDSRDNLIFLRELGMEPGDNAPDAGGRDARRQGRGRDRQRRGGSIPPVNQPRRDADADALFDDDDDVDSSDTGEGDDETRQDPAREPDLSSDEDGPTDKDRPDARRQQPAGPGGRPDTRGQGQGRQDHRQGQGGRGSRNDGRQQFGRGPRDDRNQPQDQRDNRNDADEPSDDRGDQQPDIGNDVRNTHSAQPSNEQGYNDSRQGGGGGKRRRGRRGRGRGGQDRFEQVQPYRAPQALKPSQPFRSDAVENVVETDIDYGDEPTSAPSDDGRNQSGTNEPRVSSRNDEDRDSQADRPRDDTTETDDTGDAANTPAGQDGPDVTEGAPKRRRRRRGGRGRRGKGGAQSGPDGESDRNVLPGPQDAEDRAGDGDADGNVVGNDDDNRQPSGPSRPAVRASELESKEQDSTEQPPAPVVAAVRAPRTPKPRSAPRADGEGRRTGTRRGAARSSDVSNATGGREKVARANAPVAGGASSPVPGKSGSASPVIPLPPVAKTGSTDRHLVDDEPIDIPPPQRPRSRRDLDEVPEDYD